MLKKIKMVKALMYTKTGVKKGEIELPKSLFGVIPNPFVIAQAVRVLLINRRQETRCTKGRGDLHYSGKKIYRQKHTGGARHGDRTAAGFRKGAKAHGPKPRIFEAAIPEKIKESAMLSALSTIAEGKRVKVIDSLNFEKPKLTQKALKILEKIGFDKGLIIYSNIDKNVRLALRNLQQYVLKTAKDVSFYDVVKCGRLLITSEALKDLEKRYKQLKQNK